MGTAKVLKQRGGQSECYAKGVMYRRLGVGRFLAEKCRTSTSLSVTFLYVDSNLISGHPERSRRIDRCQTKNVSGIALYEE